MKIYIMTNSVRVLAHRAKILREELERKRMGEDTFKEIPDFVQRLIDNGWERKEAEEEWKKIQADNESGC